MATNEWKDLAWGPNPEPVDIGKLNTMVNNTKYVYDRLPKLSFRPWSGSGRDTGVKIACGVAVVPGDSTSYLQHIQVNYAGFFLQGANPVISLGLQSPAHRRAVVTFYGIDGQDTTPDHRGFGAAIAAVPTQYNHTNTLDNTMHLHWIAMGY